jgi:NACHT domain
VKDVVALAQKKTSNFEALLAAAYKVFNLSQDGRGKLNKHYIPVPAIVSTGSLPQSDPSQVLNKLNNPFIFLTGKWFHGEPLYSRQEIAAESSITFIVGQYGLGKTELVHQVCQYLMSNEQGDDLIPLPINLALCRGEVNDLRENMPRKDFARLLFSRILSETSLPVSFVEDRLLREIQQGKVILLLDGLDELISSPAQNHYFLSNLSKFLTSPTSSPRTEPRCRVGITMRLEYLSSVASQDASDLCAIVNSSAPTNVSIQSHFLKLDFLDDSRVDAYFRIRLTKGRDAFEKVIRNKRLLDMLRRPLLLRIFCDLAKLRGSKKLHLLLDSLKDNEHPSRLLEMFVEWAEADECVVKDQNKITSLSWDADKLARKSVDLYEAGKSEMNLHDVKQILKNTDPSAPEINVEELGDTEALEGIHKCPFLWKDVRLEDGNPAVEVHFGHKIFFEYFLARGIFLYKEHGDYSPWMNLVLNVDTRKFLKGMIDDCEWYERTKKSYALEESDLKKWKYRDVIDFAELEKERRLFLDYMTDPENEKYMRDSDGTLAKAVNGFLEKEDMLHPRYRMYTYEAVALYIWFHRWDEQTASISTRFSEVLEKRLSGIHEGLLLGDSPAQDALELLLERILHIGQRLRYTWAKKYVGRKDDLLTLVKDPCVHNRLAGIFDNIEKAFF